jgi:hypothetical protein
MQNFRSSSEVLDDLRRRGYTVDFDLQADCLSCGAPHNLQLNPDEFEITEVYRFEGPSDPNYNEVVYAIEGPDGVKGVLMDAYGMYANPLSTAMVAKLRVVHS